MILEAREDVGEKDWRVGTRGPRERAFKYRIRSQWFRRRKRFKAERRDQAWATGMPPDMVDAKNLNSASRPQA